MRCHFSKKIKNNTELKNNIKLKETGINNNFFLEQVQSVKKKKIITTESKFYI